ncbi:unnamed protein product [Amaranthus hypochondriacus]
MPSGAKKRKAAKKKLQKEAHNTTNYHGSHSLGTENDNKSQDERESDGGEGERESSQEHVMNSHEEGLMEESLAEQNVAEFSKEVKSEEGFNDVEVNVEDDVRETKNGEHKDSSSSSSSSGSDDDEVTVETEQVESSLPETSMENPVISEVMYSLVEESIPVEESVKQVVSVLEEVNAENESASGENSLSSNVIESESKQNFDEVLQSTDEKEKVSSGLNDHLQEKIETKVIQVVDESSGKLSGLVDIAPREGENFPQSSVVTSAVACDDNHVNESKTQKYVEEQPLVSSAPLPVRRTSWMNCCGLFEVLSGGASR